MNYIDLEDNVITRMEKRARSERLYLKTNKVFMTGVMKDELKYSHTVVFEKFFQGEIIVKRNSGTNDIIPFVVSELLLDKVSLKEKVIQIAGQYRAYNVLGDDGKSHLILKLFVTELDWYYSEDELEEVPNSNLIYLDGYICKPVRLGKTFLSKKDIANLLIAVSRNYGRSDYIPCIAWGRNARWTSFLNVGDRVQLFGRIQSREYIQKSDEMENVVRTAYEVSIMEIGLVE